MFYSQWIVHTVQKTYENDVIIPTFKNGCKDDVAVALVFGNLSLVTTNFQEFFSLKRRRNVA